MIETVYEELAASPWWRRVEKYAEARPLAIALVVVGLAACTQAPVPKDHYYRLTSPSPAGVLEPSPLSGTLVIRRFIAEGLLSERPLVYTSDTSPNKLHQYNYYFWADPPTRMLQEVMVDYLRSANTASRVVTPELRVQASYVMAGKIKRLEHVRSAEPYVTLEMEISLRRERDDELLLLRNYRVDKKLETETVQSAAAAMNAAVATACASLLDDLRKL